MSASVPHIFDAFDGPAEVGRVLSISTEHAAQMRRRNSIPVKYWSALIEGAKARNLTLSVDDLHVAHAELARVG